VKKGAERAHILSVRAKDGDFSRNEILVRDGKGQKDRHTMLPAVVKEPLAAHLEQVRVAYREQQRRGNAAVHLPDAFARKYPNAPTEWAWQWVFPASDPCAHPRTGEVRRFHLHE
jgi:hypothetical protein